LQPEFRQVVLLDADGHLRDEDLGASRKAHPGTIASGSPPGILSLVGQCREYLSPVYIDPSPANPMVLLAVPDGRRFR